MRYGIVLVAAICLLAGCGERRDETPLVTVDGKPLTVADVKEAVLVKARMAELRGKPVGGNDFGRWANRTAAKLVGSLVNAELFDREAVRCGIQPEEADRGEILARFNRQTGQSAETPEALADQFGELKRAFRTQFDRSVRIAAYCRRKHSVEVSNEMVEQYFAFKTNELENAAAIDAAARAGAAKAYQRLQAGEPWANVAKVSEDKLACEANEGYAKDWTWVGEDAMGMKELAVELPKMKVGDYSKPMDTFDGMVIVRLEEKNGGMYRLSRILFRMANPVDVPPDFETARTRIKEDIQSRHKFEDLERLQGQAKIEYPQGTNYVCRFWEENPKKKGSERGGMLK